ncbi:MAG: cation:proton antiporter [Bacteroidales bacterium]
MEVFKEQLSQQFQLPLQNPVLVFALILLIILLAPILLRRLKIPGIIGLIIAGVAFGPHGLNLLARNSAVDLFSIIGMLYLMFITGLDLELSEFRKNSIKSIGFGVATFLIPLAVGFPVCYYLLDFGFVPSLLIATMFSAHTMIAYPIVVSFGIAKNEAVAVTVGGTILTDTAVLLVLAAITGSQVGSLDAGFWLWMLASVAALLVVMFLLVPFLARWFFNRLEGEKSSHYIFILVIVFLAAFLSQVAGLEPIIGAFLAGLALNRFIPASSVLMNRIQFVGNSLFIPFFLISVGMLIDIGSLFRDFTVLRIALIITVVALAGKYLAARLTQWVFRFSRSQGLLIYGLSSSRVAATLAVVLVAYEAGIVGRELLEATVLLILVTCLVAAVITENAAKQILNEQNGPNEVGPLPGLIRESVLIPVVNIANLHNLLDFSLMIKENVPTVPIRVLSVLNNPGEGVEVQLALQRQRLEEEIIRLGVTDTPVEVLLTVDQNIPAGINRVSREQESTTLILGWPVRESLSDRVFGQKTEHLLETSEKNFFICRLTKPINTRKRIVLVCPPYSELEPGFQYVVRKVFHLAAELSLAIDLHARQKTRDRVEEVRRSGGLTVMIRDNDFADWRQFDQIVRDLSLDDIAIFLAARPGSVSYNPHMDHLVRQVNELNTDMTVILIYPMINPADDKYNKYRDFTTEPLTRSMEAFNRIQRGLGKMIQKAE